jgi:predicted metal-dependent phosphoesterase TrpH
MIVDLHSHSRSSDGELELDDLVLAAVTAGVEVLAITDHDLAHSSSRLSCLSDKNITLISGIEFSSRWGKYGIHIVGLNIDAGSGDLTDAISSQKCLREERGIRIGEKLRVLGLENALEGARQLAGEGYFGRPHFAEYMVQCGFVKDRKKAFQKYLGAGKIADTEELWPDMTATVACIKAAGGVAVLAHPLKYKLSRTKLFALCTDFKSAGGDALEVVSGVQPENATALLSAICQEGGFLASCGSDFHQPGQSWAALGRFPALPSKCIPVWDSW